MNLVATNESIELYTSAACNVDWTATYCDTTAGTTLVPLGDEGNVTTATETTVVPAPAASTQRRLQVFTATNKGTAVVSVALQKDVAGSEFRFTPEVVLAAGETLYWSPDRGIEIYDVSGKPKAAIVEASGGDGFSSPFWKTGAGMEAAGVWYSTIRAAGGPGAWSTGSPGLAGRTCNGTDVANDAGCFYYRNAVAGENYLTEFQCGSSIAHYNWIFDLLWVNTGIVVTTTTAQTVNSVAFPARDVNGGTNGDGCMIGLLVTVATTNASAISNMTVSYTNSQNVSGRTASLVNQAGSNFPATAAAGTVVWFNLQDGDTGVKSIESITLGTSLVTGTVHLIVARWIASAPATVANIGSSSSPSWSKGVRLYDGSCLFHMCLASTTTATNFAGVLRIEEH